MPGALDDMKEFHWMMTVLQNIDVGIMILDGNYNVHVWNGFMEAHSGLLPSDVQGKHIFEVFPDLDKAWFEAKAKPVFSQKIRAFTIWEQNPYLFKFRNYRPITGPSEFMYQNVTISPIVSTTGEVEYISVMIYDVTDSAIGKMQLESASVRLEEQSE